MFDTHSPQPAMMRRSSTLPAIVNVSAVAACGLARGYSVGGGGAAGGVVSGVSGCDADAAHVAYCANGSVGNAWHDDDVAELDDVLDWLTSSEGSSSADAIEDEDVQALEACLLDLFNEPPLAVPSPPAPFATTAVNLMLPQVQLCEELDKEQRRAYREQSKARWLEKRRRQRAAAAFKTHYPDRRMAAKGRKRVGGKFAREGPVFMTMEERERLEAEFGAPAA